MASAEELRVDPWSRVGEFLGGEKIIGRPRTELDFVEIIRAGFPVSVFTAIATGAKLSDSTIFRALGISPRTGARRKAGSERLKPVESELLLRFARVFTAATDVLGDADKAREWLLCENRALGGEAPIQLLDTGIGFQNVMDVLSRIESGVYS